MAVATDISEVGVNAVNRELFANLPELVLRESGDGAARGGLVPQREHIYVMLSVMY